MTQDNQGHGTRVVATRQQLQHSASTLHDSLSVALQCPTSTCVGSSPSITGDTGIDGMISTIAHEIAEAATDPYDNGWYTSDGQENADVCADE